MTDDVEFLESLARKFEQEMQVFLGYKNVERAEQLRRIAALLASRSEPAREPDAWAVVNESNELVEAWPYKSSAEYQARQFEQGHKREYCVEPLYRRASSTVPTTDEK